MVSDTIPSNLNPHRNEAPRSSSSSSAVNSASRFNPFLINLNDNQKSRTNGKGGSGKGRSYDHLPLPSNRGSKITTARDRDRDSRDRAFRWNRVNNQNQNQIHSNDNDVDSFKLSNYLSFQRWPSSSTTSNTAATSDHPTSLSSISIMDNEPIYQNPPIYKRPNQDDSLALLLPLLILLSTLLFMLLLFVILIVIVRKRSRISLNDSNTPIDVGREEDLESSNSTSSMASGILGGISGIEERWLESIPQSTRSGYLRSKDFLLSNPPNSFNTDITLQQYLSIQEKGVSAWSFEPDYENNPSVFVENRTEISFLGDGIGMTEEEGGGCNVQSNLPLPKLNEVYYWEAKMFTLPEGCNVSVGLATKPFPSFRLPGECG